MIKMTLDDFLHSKGVGYVVSDFIIDKLKIPHGLSQRQRAALERDAEKAIQEHHLKRKEATEEYNRLVAAGEIIPPTSLERRLRIAHGNPDNAATQAARRILEKRGIDWRTAELTY